MMYYFGCESKSRCGHFIFREHMISYNIPDNIRMFAGKIDGKLAPQNNGEKQGEATLNFIDGFTILAFWDRSADGRGRSNSAFLKEGNHDFDTVLTEAKEKFPTVFERFDFEVTEYKPS